MSKAVVSTFKKMDTDTSQNKQDNSSFYDAQDLRLISDEPLSNGALVNYKGTKAKIDLGSRDNKVVGYAEVGSELVLLTHNNSTIKYGYLYNWYASVDNRNIAPVGWHVPSDAEWTTLTTYLGGESVAGGELKEIGTSRWLTPNTGATNSSGFTAIPGGAVTSGIFGSIYDRGFWWTGTESDSNNAWHRRIFSNNTTVDRSYAFKYSGNSIRCIRDAGNTSTIATDIDGNIYTSVTIGTQTWMVENLATTKYRNGDIILSDFTGTVGAICSYNNDKINSIINPENNIVSCRLTEDNELNQINTLYTCQDNGLGFFGLNNVETIGRYENEFSKKIYFAVPDQPLRVFNIANNTLNTSPVSTLDILPNNYGATLSLEANCIIQGGKLETGKIQYACKLFNKYGAETTFSPCSELISLTSDNYNGSNEFKGSDLEVNSGKSVKVAVSIPNTYFKYIHIYSIHYKVKDTPVISLVGEIAIPSNYSSFNFIDNGTVLDTITLEEFNIFGGKLISATTIGTKNNILFAANTKEINETISLDCRAYRFNSDGDSRIYTNDNVAHPSYWLISSDGALLQKYVWGTSSYNMVEELLFSNYAIPLEFDCINRYNNEFEKVSGESIHPYIYDKKSDGVTYGGTGKIVSYEIKVDQTPTKLMDNGETIVNKDNIDFILKKTSFKQGETYRVGLSAYDLKGKPYFTEWVGDIRIPYFTGNNDILINTMYGPYDTNINNIDTSAKNIYIDFSINTTNIDTYYPGLLSKISGFEIVKVQRELSDKSIIAQGCSIGGVVFNGNLVPLLFRNNVSFL